VKPRCSCSVHTTTTSPAAPPPPTTILPFAPSGAGATSQLVNPNGGSVDNFKFVNKRRDDLVAGGWVTAATTTDKDTYTIGKVPDEFHAVNAIKMSANTVRYGTTITKLKMLVKPALQAEIAQPAAGLVIPQGDEQFVLQNFSENANTSAPFTLGELDGMETGIQFIA